MATNKPLYQRIASAISVQVEDHQDDIHAFSVIQEVAERVTEVFEAYDPNFHSEAFLKCCGVWNGVEA